MMSVNVKFDDPAFILNQALIEGRSPDIWQLSRLGVDVPYLDKIVNRVKGRLPEMPEYQPLKSTIFSGKNEERQRKFSEASVADVPCLRLGFKRGDYYSYAYLFEPLLSLYPKDDLSRYAPMINIELFITFRGEWILYDERSSDEEAFTLCRSVEELKSHLEGLGGDTHRLNPSVDTVLFNIGRCLIVNLKNEIDRLRKNIEYHEATLAECMVLQKRLNLD